MATAGYDISASNSTSSSASTGAINFGDVVIPTGVGGASGSGSLSTVLIIGAILAVLFFWKK